MLCGVSPKILVLTVSSRSLQAKEGMAKFRDLYLPAAGLGKNVSLQFSAGILILPTVSRVFVIAEVAHHLVVTNAPTAAEVAEPFPRQPKVLVSALIAKTYLFSNMPPHLQTCCEA